MLPEKPVIKISSVFFYREVRITGSNRIIFGGWWWGVVELCLLAPFVQDNNKAITMAQSLKICLTSSCCIVLFSTDNKKITFTIALGFFL